MNLGEWTKALLAAIVSQDPKTPDYAPPWLVLDALQQLGFENQAIELAEALHEKEPHHIVFGARTMAEDETRACRKWRPYRGRGGRRRSALIFSKSSRAAIAHERPSERYAAMALGFDDLTKKVKKIWAPDAREIMKFLDSPLVAVEMPADERSKRQLSDDEEALVRFFTSDPEQPVCLVLPEPSREYLPSRYRAMTAKTLEEVFSEA